MASYDGIETDAFVTQGVLASSFVSATGGENIASLFASQGMLETAPVPVAPVGGKLRGQVAWLLYWLRRR